MANIRITDLTAYTNPDATDVLPIVDVGADITKKVAIGDLLKNASSGTAAAPGIAFDGDSNTGIYSPGADQVAVSTGGSEAARIDSSGRVGIGTTSPSTELEVVATSPEIKARATGNSTSKLTLDSNRAANLLGGQIYGKWDGNDVSAIRFVNGAGGTNKDDGLIAFSTSNGGSSLQERLRIAQNGDVGIGTTAPQAKLDVQGKAILGAAPTRVNENSYDLQVQSAGNAELKLQAGATSTSYLAFGTTSNALATGFAVNNNDGDLRIRAGNTERLRIDSSGRFLVGASSVPTIGGLDNAKLTVSDSAGSRINILRRNSDSVGGQLYFAKAAGTGVEIVSPNDSVGRISCFGADGVDLNSEAARIEAMVDGTPGVDDMPGRLLFSTTPAGLSVPQERMRIDNAGAISTFASSNPGLTFRNSAAASGTLALIYGLHSSTSTTDGGTISFIVRTNGDVENTNNSYGAISDIKLKENIVDASSQWDDLKALQVRNYNFKPETNHQTHTQIGLIAQEAELVSPGLVSESPDRDEDGNDLGTVTKSVNYSVLYMKAVKALQEAMERIETLEAKVAALEAP